MEKEIEVKWKTRKNETNYLEGIFPDKYCSQCIFSNIQNDMKTYKIICKKEKQIIKEDLEKEDVYSVEIPKWCSFKN